MRKRNLGCAVTILVAMMQFDIAAGQQAQPAKPVQLTIFDRLYKLIWPLGRFEGDLARTVAKATERSTATGIPELFIVDTVSGRVVLEWPKSSGATQATFCPENRLIFYKRGPDVFSQGVELDGIMPKPAGTPQLIEKLQADRLYVCTGNGENLDLWVTSGDEVQVARVNPRTMSWEYGAVEITDPSMDRWQMAELLQRMRTLRPDGTRIFARDNKLLRAKGDQEEPQRVLESPLRFYGVPAWIPDSELVLVHACRSEWK